MKRTATCLGLALVCGACTTQSPLPAGPAAYQVISSAPAPAVAGEYRIEPLDTVTVRVFNEPELSVENGLVDTGGNLPIPLLGSVSVAGKAPGALADELERDLAEYLINPRVTVSVGSIIQRVAVEGLVKQPGLYDIRGSSSLLEAMALAQSPTETADLDQIFVYRMVGGQMTGARFDLARIRVGLDPDPVIMPGDRIVVGLDEFEDAWRTYFADPVDSVFRILAVCSVSSDRC